MDLSPLVFPERLGFVCTVECGELVAVVDQYGGRRLTNEAAGAIARFQRLKRFEMRRGGFVPDALRTLGVSGGVDDLRLPGCDITEDVLDDIAALPGLRRLDLSETSLDDRALVKLRPLHCIEELDLRATAISGEAGRTLRDFGGLRVLSVAKTGFDDRGLAYISSCVGLRSLDCSATTITDRGIAHIGALENLETLSIRGTFVSGACAPALSRLRALCEVDLAFTSFDDDGLRQLYGSRLKRLIIKGSNTTSVGAERYESNNPDVVIEQAVRIHEW